MTRRRAARRWPRTLRGHCGIRRHPPGTRGRGRGPGSRWRRGARRRRCDAVRAAARGSRTGSRRSRRRRRLRSDAPAGAHHPRRRARRRSARQGCGDVRAEEARATRDQDTGAHEAELAPPAESGCRHPSGSPRGESVLRSVALRRTGSALGVEGPQRGDGEAGDDVPDTPPAGDDRHAAEAAEEGEDQSEPEAGVADADLELALRSRVPSPPTTAVP